MMQSFFWSMIIPVLKRLEIWEKLFPNQSFWSKTWAGSEDLIMFDMFESVQRLWPHCLGCPISPLQPQGRWVQFLETRLCCSWAEPPLLTAYCGQRATRQLTQTHPQRVPKSSQKDSFQTRALGRSEARRLSFSALQVKLADNRNNCMPVPDPCNGWGTGMQNLS